ncbi:PP2C family protein-serine/threonine phosphatase [Ferdinandcohnia quinoae]|uniref:Serine/threonine-protein phosphatase n=1 Tax=Fredinandcohnia quinoae TaxID=2918902 RepID=A0AAW5DWN7_9BACI|nr:PP2C family protein-serine/threonine phosphatase [Fredinandcohnia sp. SECRCQ15]MCH1625051.1 serine/threonine-protein phosphatase [Fredinandcohnia sp. SECRCQ15]
MFMDSLSYTISTGSYETDKLDKSLQREINLAKNIQASLLNGKTPLFEGGEVSGSSVPARLIGGDYFDFYPLVNGNIRIVIGDVMGKGIPAAMLMILTRGAFRSAAESTQGPGETLTAMNQALFDDLRTLKSFVTLFCADWNPKTSKLTYANAGHNPPLLIKGKSNCVEELPKAKGIMVGGLPNQVYLEKTIQLEEHDTAFFYTDGIVEAQNKSGEQFKLQRLTQTLLANKDKGVGEIEKSVMDSINEFTEGMPQRDDITMVLLKISERKADITSLNSPVLW